MSEMDIEPDIEAIPLTYKSIHVDSTNPECFLLALAQPFSTQHGSTRTSGYIVSKYE